ncbi:MAG: UPF0182 family protein [Micromonosporaceae bacterium]
MRSPLPRVSRRGRVTIIVISVVIILLTVLGRLVDLWTDWLWFQEVNYTGVFGGLIRAKILLFVLFGLAMAGFVGGNLYLAYRLRPLMRTHSAEQHALERYRMLLTPRIGLWISVAAGLLGVFAGLSAQGHWQQWLLFWNGRDFGITDPQFHVDIGFYVFRYPFYRFLLDFGFTAATLAVLGSIAVHYLYGGVRLQGVGDRMTTGARAHLTALVAFFVLLKAVAYFLDKRGLTLDFNSGTDLWGGGYSDINAVLPAKEILTYISIVVAVAILIFSNVGTRNLVWAGASLALLGISAVTIGGIYPAAVQQFTVKPNIRDKEADYILRTIEGTRQAYGLTGVQRTSYPAQTLTPPPSLAKDQTVVPTIRLLDPAVVNDTYTQFQQIRAFYDFNDKLDVDRYLIDGKVQDYVVGVREINYTKLQGQQNNWQNRHTVFTHGYGFVAAPANRVVAECGGAPFFVSGFLGEANQSSNQEQCVAPTELIKVSQPRIYYGELSTTDDYVVVGRSPSGRTDPEFDRPSGDSEMHFTYDGKGGVPVASFGRRLLYALHFREGNFLLSDVFNENSKVIYIRDPRERVERVAPFLALDGDPYPAVIGGRVTWILDGYTTSASFPYSQRVDLREVTSDALTGTGTAFQAKQNINYIRNSVKATVDAYDGTVTLYEFDDQDPILRAWNKAFGGNVIKPKAAIPADLAAHFRYPEDLFKVQRDLLAKFHISDPREFNSAQNFWQVPEDPAKGGSGVKQPPYFLLTQFPGENSQRFQLTSALTPTRRQNLSSLLTGSVIDNKLSLELLELPGDNRIPGPGQAQQNMSTDADVRREITFLQGTGSQAQVIYGNLLSLPYGGGMLYVQPVFIKGNVDNSFPLLKLVLVNYGTTVAYASSLPTAINNLIQKGGQQPSTNPENPPTTPTGPVSGDLAAAAAKIQAAIDKLHRAQESGDFAAYGTALKELDDAVKEFQAVQARLNSPGATPSPTPSG